MLQLFCRPTTNLITGDKISPLSLQDMERLLTHLFQVLSAWAQIIILHMLPTSRIFAPAAW